MKTLVFVIVISGSLIAIASGIWVAIALGSAISKKKAENVSEISTKDSIEQQ